MYDVITVGSATVDAFVQTGSQLFRKSNVGTDNCVSVPFGSKILIENIKFDVGGGGTNTAVALSRLGLKTSFLGKIGMGQNSERVIRLLQKEGVDVSLVVRSKDRTGFSIILDATGHDRTILAFKGSNNKLRYDEIKKSLLRTKWFYFSSMVGESLETLKKLALYAKRHNIKIVFNPSSYLAKKGSTYLSGILDNTNILVLNREEATLLLATKSNNIYIPVSYTHLTLPTKA